MKITVTIAPFPMALASRFADEIRKYADAGIAFKGKGTATVHLDNDDIVKILEVCTICDKYAIAEGDDIIEKFEL